MCSSWKWEVLKFFSILRNDWWCNVLSMQHFQESYDQYYMTPISGNWTLNLLLCLQHIISAHIMALESEWWSGGIRFHAEQEARGYNPAYVGINEKCFCSFCKPSSILDESRMVKKITIMIMRYLESMASLNFLKLYFYTNLREIKLIWR